MIQANMTIRYTNILEQCITNWDPLKDFDIGGMLNDIGIPQSLFNKANVFLV